jgi:hypothetical protein
MTDFSKATPRPWTAHGPIVFMYDEGGFDLRNCPEPEANAALIVEAVNSYEAQADLIKELVDALAKIEALAVDWEFYAIEKHARSALAKAKAVTE